LRSKLKTRDTYYRRIRAETMTTVVPTIPTPRIVRLGMFGTYDVAWTGGSKLATTKLSEPKGINGYRPMGDFRSLRSTMEACQKPLEESKHLDFADTKTSKITFISWMSYIPCEGHPGNS
jgi:hypothetical protein